MSSSRTGEPAIGMGAMDLSPHLDREEVARVLDLDGYLRDELQRSAVERQLEDRRGGTQEPEAVGP